MGRIVHTPKQPHRCAVQDPIGPYSHSPIDSVYECECGKTWVARKHPVPGQMYRHWVPESRRSRRHRRRTAERERKRWVPPTSDVPHAPPPGGASHECDYVEPDGTTMGVCHLPGVHGGRGGAA